MFTLRALALVTPLLLAAACPVHAQQTRPATAPTAVRVQRVALRDCGPAAVAVDTGAGVCYAFDTTKCRLRLAWAGGFLDASPPLAEGIAPAAEVAGRVWWRDDRRPFVRIAGLPSTQPATQLTTRAAPPTLTWPAGQDDVPPTVQFVGYDVANAPAVDFEYRVDGVRVRERIAPAAPFAVGDANVVGLVRSFTVDPIPTGGEVRLAADGDAGASFVFPAASGARDGNAVLFRGTHARAFEVRMTPRPGQEPLRYWSMDAETGTSGVADYAVVGRSARFDGLRAAVPTGLTVDQLGERWTIGGWVRPLQRTDDRVEPVFAARDEQGTGFAVNYDGGKGVYVLETLPAGPRALRGPDAPRPPHPVRAFQHVAVVVALGRAALYVDGEPAGRLELPTVPRAKLSIGSDGRAGEGFRGLIDEVRLWDRALIAAELTDFRKRDKDAAEVDRPRLDRLDPDLEPGGNLK